MPINRIKGSGDNLAEVKVAVNDATNLDELEGLVVNAILSARWTAGSVLPLRSNYPAYDTRPTDIQHLQTIAKLQACNGTTWDRIRSRTSDGGDQNNSTVGCQIVINLNYVWDAANTKWVPMTQP